MERTTDISGTLSPRDFAMGSFSAGLSNTDAFTTSIASGVMESFALGPAIREGTVFVDEPDNPVPLSEDDYKSSPYFRKEIPYDDDMTQHRAAALAEFHDAKRAREHKLSKTPGWALKTAGNITGQALDPINYIPILGPTARVAATVRLGAVGGRALVASADAAINTAIFGAFTAPLRILHGEPVTMERLMLEVATAAVIGSVFGGVGGALSNRRASVSRTALAEVETSRQNLEDAVSSFVETGEIRVRPETLDRVREIADKQDFTPRVLTDTAVRAPEGAPVETNFDEFVRSVAAEADPKLAAAVKRTTTKLETAETKLDTAEARLATAEVAAVRKKDPAAGDILETIDNRLKENIPARERTDLTRQRENILDTLGVREADVKSGPLKAIRSAEKSVDKAKREAAGVRRDVDLKVEQQTALAKALRRPKTDGYVPPPDPAPPEASTALAKVKSGENTPAEVAEEVGVNPETGEFPEQDAYDILATQDRLSPEDVKDFERATEVVERTEVYANALRQAGLCEVG